jgi:hypothetical protein
MGQRLGPQPLGGEGGLQVSKSDTHFKPDPLHNPGERRARYVVPDPLPEVKHLMLKPAPALVQGLLMVADLTAT